MQLSVTNNRTGASVDQRGDQNGEALVADSLARYYSMVRRGNVFFAANTAVQALSVNSATATGLILSNPIGSGKNLVLLDVCVALGSVPAAISEVVLTGNATASLTAVTHTAALTINNVLTGQQSITKGTSVANADSQATVPTPAVMRALGAYLWIATAANVIGTPVIRDEIAGALVIGPGCAVSVQALTTAISAISSMTWAEEPL
jgi:hypothetical protein